MKKNQLVEGLDLLDKKKKTSSDYFDMVAKIW
jgi:hypothetical protein